MTFKEFLETLTHWGVGPFHGSGEKRKATLAYNTFSQEDRKALQQPSLVRKLEQVLNRFSSYNFNIIMLEPDKQTRLAILANNKKAAEQYYLEYINRYIEEGNIQLAGHITFVKSSSTGHPVTPWMILHTLGHALEKYPVVEQIRINLRNIANLQVNQVLPISHWGNKTTVVFATKIFKFLSARITQQTESDPLQRKIELLDELIFELIAEYIWHNGKIRYQLPQNIDQEKLKYYISVIETNIKTGLDKVVGTIIYDLFTD